MRFHAVRAVAAREFHSYFSSPAGYVFITLFVFVSAVAAFWQERFFQSNLANLDPLNAWFPYLLIFLVPSITMGLWAEERKQGTEELLLTLPARGVEIVAGKYAAALGIYTVALIFSLSHAVVLMWLGAPDPGLLFSTYFGYWLMGAALLPLGLLASQLTENLTVAFIGGAALCSLPVMFQHAGAVLQGPVRPVLEQLSAPEQLRDLASGIVSSGPLVYCAALAAAVLYLCVRLTERRRWRTPALGRHYAVRTLALLVAAGAASLIAARSGARLDVTSEQIHSLAPDTVELLRGLDSRHPVMIQAYISPEAPRSYSGVRSDLIRTLREFAAAGRDRIQPRIVETVKYSPEAREARERYGILPFRVPAAEESASAANEIFLGLVFTCGAEEFVIPFFDRGLPVEYELMRSIRVVSRASRKRVGILQTEAKLFGGFDFQTRQNAQDWSIVQELRKQYEVVRVAPEAEYPANLDVLVAAHPTTLDAPQLARLTAYVKTGKPVFVLVDPMPAFNINLAPAAGESSWDVRALMTALGVEWAQNRIAWDKYNPHPQLGELPPEVVFVGAGNGASMPFQQKAALTAGLQELVLLYPGVLKAKSKAAIPLLTTGTGSGTLRFDQLVETTMMGRSIVRGLPHTPDKGEHVLAYRVKDAARNAVVIADVDVMGEEFFELRRRGVETLNLDNVTFVLNAIDELAGGTSFIALRNRRPKHRTLELVEARTRVYEEKRAADSRDAAVLAERRLQEAQARLDAAVATVRARADLDDQARQIMISNLQTAETRRLQVARQNIQDERERQMEDARVGMESSVRRIQNTIKLLAVGLPPVPAFLLFLLMSLRKLRRERMRIAPERLLSAAPPPTPPAEGGAA
ncbi:MAG: Gldg family protein [Bryobacterales bacterium]|nr:Gldg family protein [Bryobacterales bacterium]